MTNQRYKFPIACCPLCHTEIVRLSGSYGREHVMWQCPQLVIPVEGGRPLPHYQVEWDKSTGTIAQHVIVGQFYLDTFNTDYRTRIHVAIPAAYVFFGSNNRAKHVVTIPQIRMDTLDKLLERVKTLVLFS